MVYRNQHRITGYTSYCLPTKSATQISDAKLTRPFLFYEGAGLRDYQVVAMATINSSLAGVWLLIKGGFYQLLSDTFQCHP